MQRTRAGRLLTWQRPLSSRVVFIGSGEQQPGWADFMAREQVHALWDFDLLSTMAESPDPFSPLVTVSVRHHDEIVGIFVATYRGVRPRSAPRRGEPVLVDVRMTGQGHGPSWRLGSGLSPDQQRSVVREFERALLSAIGRARLTGVIYRNVDPASLAGVRRPGALVTDAAGGGGTTLHLPATVDEYLARLSSSRRKQLRRLGRRMPDRARIEFSPKRTDLDPEEVAALVALGNSRHSGAGYDPRPAIPPAYFATLLAREDVSTLSYHVGDRLVGVGTFLRHPRHPWGGYWAMLRPGEGGLSDLYFDHYLRYVRYAVEEEGAATLTSGKGMLTEKRTVGFEVTPLSFVPIARPFVG